MIDKISKLYAIIESRRSPKGSINTVVGIRLNDNSLVTDQKSIAAIFGEGAEVFAGRTFEGKNESLIEGELIEIPVIEIKLDEKPKPAIHHNPVLRKQISHIVAVPEKLLAENYLDLVKIEGILSSINLVTNVHREIYLSDNTRLYGPFKVNGAKLEPKIGKEVAIFDLNQELLVTYKQGNLLVEKPNIELGKRDCMSNLQLLEWVKVKINVFGTHNGEVNRVIDLLKKSSQNDSELDSHRFRRAMGVLDRLELSLEEVKALKSTHEPWERIFQAAYESHKSQLAQEHLIALESKFMAFSEEYSSRKVVFANELSELSEKVSSESARLIDLKEEVSKAQRELVYLTNSQVEILLNLKIQANLASGNQTSTSKIDDLQTFEVRYFRASTQAYCNDLSDYLDFLKNGMGLQSSNRKLFEQSLGIMADKKFLLANNPFFLMALLQSLGNGVVYVQHAEADWIKFEKIYRNGLRDIVELAESNPCTKHFFILLDFNLPSIACYGKPLLDIADKLRIHIPGTSRAWPDNLYIFMIPLSFREDGLGFGVNKLNFQNWGVLPFVEDFDRFKGPEPETTIIFEQIDDQLIDRSNADISKYLDD